MIRRLKDLIKHSILRLYYKNRYAMLYCINTCIAALFRNIRIPKIMVHPYFKAYDIRHVTDKPDIPALIAPHDTVHECFYGTILVPKTEHMVNDAFEKRDREYVYIFTNSQMITDRPMTIYDIIRAYELEDTING